MLLRIIRKIKPLLLSFPASSLRAPPPSLRLFDWLLQKRGRKIYPRARPDSRDACVRACVLIRNNVHYKYAYFNWSDMFPRECTDQWLLAGSMI